MNENCQNEYEEYQAENDNTLLRYMCPIECSPSRQFKTLKDVESHLVSECDLMPLKCTQCQLSAPK